MSDLSSALHSLVDRPLAPPAPVESVVARSRRLRAQRRWIQSGTAAVFVTLLAGLGAVAAHDGPPSTTLTLSGARAKSAGYIATAPGGYRGEGTWRLTINRHGQTIELTDKTGPPCGPTGAIQPGDEVRGEIRGQESLLRAGESAHC